MAGDWRSKAAVSRARECCWACAVELGAHRPERTGHNLSSNTDARAHAAASSMCRPLPTHRWRSSSPSSARACTRLWWCPCKLLTAAASGRCAGTGWGERIMRRWPFVVVAAQVHECVVWGSWICARHGVVGPSMYAAARTTPHSTQERDPALAPGFSKKGERRAGQGCLMQVQAGQLRQTVGDAAFPCTCMLGCTCILL